ncbi:Uncharacterised protein [Yersinia nurmii]|uniref:Uncharacterized protein n=1 Tax=Yersinia nurmii TaxID=685706 RepID=A0ABM9S1W9_9GAMM|nr:Uncharacterised protein [Yersinia nurmii]
MGYSVLYDPITINKSITMSTLFALVVHLILSGYPLNPRKLSLFSLLSSRGESASRVNLNLVRLECVLA